MDMGRGCGSSEQTREVRLISSVFRPVSTSMTALPVAGEPVGGTSADPVKATSNTRIEAEAGEEDAANTKSIITLRSLRMGPPCGVFEQPKQA